MWNERQLWIQWRGNVLHLELIWVTPINFAFLRWYECSSRLVNSLVGDSLEFNQTYRGSLCVWLGKRNCSACSSRLVTVLLGTLWSSIKQIEAPYVFDWENAIALDTMQGNRASSSREWKVSFVFSSCGRNLGYILELQRGCPFETLGCSLKSGTCLGMRDNSGM